MVSTESTMTSNNNSNRASHQARTHRRAPISYFGSRTDVGCVRAHNEDSLVVTPPLFVVADGMGGHAAGEVASEIAVTTIAEKAPTHADANALGEAVCAANAAILRGVEEGRGRKGMGTTCTAAILEGERLVLAQVGDSRAYLLHGGRMQQLTRDHSLMADMIEAGQLTPEEARVHPQRSVITRALGSDPNTQPDLYEINVETGDRLLLCSDGLYSMLRYCEIEKTLSDMTDPQRCATQLVNQAIAAGGHDNITVIVVDATGLAEKKRKKIARKTKRNIALVLLLFVVLIAGTIYAFASWTNTVAYLAEKDGHVAIYKGVSGSVLGLSFSQLEEETDVSVSDLQPGLANRLREGGISADNVDAARALVKEYREEISQKSSDSSSKTPQTNSDDTSEANSTTTTTDDTDEANSSGITSTSSSKTAAYSTTSTSSKSTLLSTTTNDTTNKASSSSQGTSA